MLNLRSVYHLLRQPWCVAGLLVLSACLIIAAVLYERSRSTATTLSIMASTADSLARTIASASDKTARSISRIEQETVENLQIKLRLLRELDDSGGLSPSNAPAYTTATGLSIFRFNDSGACTLASPTAGLDTNTILSVLPPLLMSFTNTALQELILNLRDSGSITSYWKCAAAACQDGSTLVLVPPADTFSYRYSFGIGPLLQELYTLPDVEYIVWEDENGIISVQGDPDSAEQDGPDAVQEFSVPSMLQLTGGSTGMFRIGMNTSGLKRIERESLVRLAILISAIVIVSIILVRSSFMRRQYEKERAQHERLVSIGELAAGVAHEVRNPLNAVALTLQQLSSEPGIRNADSENAALLQIAGDEIKRANATLTDFLQFARPPKLSVQPVSLPKICGNVFQVVHAQSEQQQVSVIQTYEDRLPDAAADPLYLHQALLNIVLNALEAMPDGGRITCRVTLHHAELVIQISDTGPGIPAANRNSVFDLFYTTKHKGVGMGLAFVHKIISMHNGTVKIEENKSVGTTVIVTLPEYSGNG